MTRHLMIDFPPFLSITPIFVALTLNFSSVESHLATSSPNLFLLSEPSCQVSLPLTLSKSPTITYTLVSALKVVSVLTVT